MLFSLVACSSSGLAETVTETEANTASEPETTQKNEDKGPIVIPEGYSAGFARVTLNPDRGTFLGGFSDGNRRSNEILDDIKYTCTAISNGTDKPVRITAVDVAVYDDATGELIAGGKATVEEDVIVQVAGVTYYPFYISPEHIQLAEDASLPEVCSFDILLDSVVYVYE